MVFCHKCMLNYIQCMANVYSTCTQRISKRSTCSNRRLIFRFQSTYRVYTLPSFFFFFFFFFLKYFMISGCLARGLALTETLLFNTIIYYLNVGIYVVAVYGFPQIYIYGFFHLHGNRVVTRVIKVEQFMHFAADVSETLLHWSERQLIQFKSKLETSISCFTFCFKEKYLFMCRTSVYSTLATTEHLRPSKCLFQGAL